jgi:hypothetical protein
VRGGAVLPLAQPTLHTADPASYRLTVRVYGDGELPITLYEDDGVSLDYQQEQYNRLEIAWEAGEGKLTRRGEGSYPQYVVEEWIT